MPTPGWRPPAHWPPPAPSDRRDGVPAPWPAPVPTGRRAWPAPPPPPSPRPADPAGPATTSSRPPATWGRRVLALLLDAAVAGLGGLVIVLAVTRPHAVPTSAGGLTLQWRAGRTFMASALLYLAYVAYFTFLGGSRRGQTVGAMATGIAVRDAGSQGQIGAARGLVRALVVAAFVVPLLPVLAAWLLDVLWPLRDPARQALHDKLARSVVVDIRA